VNPHWEQSLGAFCQAMRDTIGEQPKVSFWPYRIGDAAWVAFDTSGSLGDVTLTIAKDDHIDIPIQDLLAGSTDPVCLVIDSASTPSTTSRC
jgi:hypothetical protein